MQTGFELQKPQGKVCSHVRRWSTGLSDRHWSGRPAFNPRSCHTKNFKNGTLCLPA